MSIELEYVQHMILFDAADIANRVIAEEGLPSVRALKMRPDGTTVDEDLPVAGFASGQIFRADPAQSTKGGLCLSIDEGITHALNQSQIARLHRIGTAALKEALVKNQDKFVGLILGEAREGRNYFDRFPPNDPPGRPGQGRLF